MSLFVIWNSSFDISQVPLEGVEPPLTCVNMDLNHARLPIPPQRPVVRLVMMSNWGVGRKGEALVGRR